eukprot:851280_1
MRSENSIQKLFRTLQPNLQFIFSSMSETVYFQVLAKQQSALQLWRLNEVQKKSCFWVLGFEEGCSVKGCTAIAFLVNLNHNHVMISSETSETMNKLIARYLCQFSAISVSLLIFSM